MLETQPTIGDTAWFQHDRFGMFIHWGIYAAGARYEWLQTNEKIPTDKYARFFDHFDPDLYDPKAWARAAREAGMKYFVITTKHHDGFCLWNSQFTEFKAPNSPAQKDLLTPMIEAFRAEGIRVGFYYSLIDWNHPHFPIDNIHPLRDNPDAVEMNKSRDVSIYAEYMRNQVRELLTQFGDIDILWFDFSYPAGDANYPQFKGKGHEDWESEKLMTMIRELAPTAIVNNRLDLANVAADVTTPEQYQPRGWVKVNGKPVVWEACQTFSGSWGYHRDETTWKSPEQLLRMLIDTVSKGGNLLMNVGPTARGVFDSRALDALKVYEEWMKWNARSIYGCTQSEFQAPTDLRYTFNPKTNRLYVHLFAYPFRHLYLPDLNDKVEYAQFLHDASEIQLELHDWTALQVKEESKDAVLILEVPVIKPNITVPVIELFLK